MTNEQSYFRQFVGDTPIVTGYFLYCDGTPYLGCIDKDVCEQKLAEMSKRFSTFKWDIRIHETLEDTFGQYGMII